MSRALAYVQQQPWAITREGLSTVLSVAARENRDVEAIEREMGRELEHTRDVTVRDGVAIVPVHGPLVRYGNLFSRISGATSLEVLSRDFHAALEDPQVHSIVLEIDSPGGQVNGTEELAELIHEARGQKPVIAFVSHFAASGAYWLASAADEVVTVRTGVLGSIGAVLRIHDFTKADEKEGIEEITFVSSVSPRKDLDPKTDTGAEEIQRMVDDLGNAFVAVVARNRGVSVDHVLEHYGQGGVLVGERAVQAGLADRLSTLEDLIAELSAAPGGRTTPRGGSMPPTAETDQTQAPEITVEFVREKHPAVANQLVAEAAGEIAERERDRILGIQALHAPGLDELRAQLARDPEVSVDNAARQINEALAARSAEAGQKFLSDRRDDEEKSTPPSPSSGDEPSVEEVHANRILTAGKPRAAS